MDRKVYIRYDPADLSEVRLYDAETDAYLRTVERSPLEADYGEDPEAVSYTHLRAVCIPARGVFRTQDRRAYPTASVHTV